MLKPERFIVVNVLKRVAGTNRSCSHVSLKEREVVSSGVSVVSATTTSSLSPQLFFRTMMTQVSVSSDQERSTSVWPAPVWWISASFLAVTDWGREEQEECPDTRYISGRQPGSDNREDTELLKLHTRFPFITISLQFVVTSYQSLLWTPPQSSPPGTGWWHCYQPLR